MQQVGPGQGRVHRQRQLAAPDLRPRGAADDRPVRDDRERAARSSGRRPSPSAWAPTRSIRTTCSATSRPKATCRTKATSASARNGPYEIAYGSLVPKQGQCENLLVPVCVSSSHIAFGSIRMEPVFMILGQSAATAAVLAIDGRHARCRTCRTPSCASDCCRTARCSNPRPRSAPVQASPRPSWKESSSTTRKRR